MKPAVIRDNNIMYAVKTLYTSAGKAVITIAIRLRYDYDVSRAPASIRRDTTWEKINTSTFRRSRVVVVS